MRMLRIVLCLAVLCSCISWQAVHGENFLVGLSNVDITPMNDRYQLQGHNVSRLAKEGKYNDPDHAAYAGSGALGLSVRAVYIAHADGSQPFVLASVDVAHLCSTDTDDVRNPKWYTGALKPLTQQRILVSATHTHTAPASCDLSVHILSPDLEQTAQVGSAWRVQLVAAMKQAVQQAITNAELSTIRFRRNKTTGQLAYCRRPPTNQLDMTADNGVDLRDLYPNTDVYGYDHTLDVVDVTTLSGRRSGVLFFWGAHPDALGSYTLPDGEYHYHPDFPGFARSVVESVRPNDHTIAIFVQAAGGDVNGFFTDANGVTSQSYSSALQTGEGLGARVNAMLDGSAQPANYYDEAIASGTSDAAFDQLFPLSLQTAAGAARLGGSPGEPRGLSAAAPAGGQNATGDWLRWSTLYCNGMNGQGGGNAKCGDDPKSGFPTTLDAEVQSVSIGNWRIAALSHEVMGLWGAELRQNWPAQRVSVVGYANRVNDYLATAHMVDKDDDYFKTGFDCGQAFDAFCAQFLYGLPAPWATFNTTNRQFDMETELHDRLRNTRRTNFALAANGGIASASTEYVTSDYPAGSFAVSGIIDGDRRGLNWTHGGGWRSNTTTNFQPPQWASVAFSAPQTIRAIDVFTLQDTEMSPVEPTKTLGCLWWCINDYDVQYKDSTGSWVTVPSGQVNASGNVWRQFVFAPITTQEIRVWVRWGQASAARIVELEAWDYPERSNVARADGVVATALNGSADSEFTAQGWTFNPQSVVNGNRRGDNWLHDGGWRSHTTNFSSPETLAIALGGYRTVDEIDVFTTQDGTYPCGPLKDPSILDRFNAYPCVGYGSGIVDFSVLYRDTNQQWSTIKHVTNNPHVWSRFVFAPVQTDAIRIVVNYGMLSAARIIQVEAWGW